MRTPALALALALALPLAGCIQNVADLKQRLGADEGEPLSESSLATDLSKNATHPPPVARIAIYAQNGALLYKASFVAQNETAPVLIEPDANLTFVATDSEAFG